MTTSFSPVETEDGTTPIATLNEPFGERVCQSGERIGVSQIKHSLTDEEREAAAYRAGVAMKVWYDRYQTTGDRQALSVAHRHLTQMLAILAKQGEGA